MYYNLSPFTIFLIWTWERKDESNQGNSISEFTTGGTRNCSSTRGCNAFPKFITQQFQSRSCSLEERWMNSFNDSESTWLRWLFMTRTCELSSREVKLLKYQNPLVKILLASPNTWTWARMTTYWTPHWAMRVATQGHLVHLCQHLTATSGFFCLDKYQ